MADGTFNGTTGAQRRDYAASLLNADTTLLQRIDTPANVSGDISAGASTTISGGRIGFIAAGSYSNAWRTRDALQQTTTDPGLAGTPLTSFQTVSTDNRIIVSGLIGLGANSASTVSAGPTSTSATR